MKNTEELLKLINSDQITPTTFRGNSISIGSPNVFGGQVLSQALNAAYRTIDEDRLCHSLHGYFILHGDLNKPIIYKVQQVRDGGSFTTRYVTAEQNKKSIFVMASSFQKEEKGYDFQQTMPKATPPEELKDWTEIYETYKDVAPERWAKYLAVERPIIFKPEYVVNPLKEDHFPPFQNVWFKFNKPTENLSRQNFHEILAYASDYNILMTTLQPHSASIFRGDMMMASLDHAIWFHRIPTDYSGWFLYHIDVVSTSNARGLATGKIFTCEGQLIATVSQEGLMRKIK